MTDLLPASMPLPELLLLAGLVAVLAFLYASVGHAGASGYLAAMGLFAVAPAEMKPTALLLNVLVASLGTLAFARAGCFERRLFVPLAAASVPAAFLGGMLVVPERSYRVIVGGILLWAAWRLFASTRRREEPVARVPQVGWLLATGAGLGLLSGLTGVGGGIFLSPLLLLLGWADARRTAGVSVAFILVNSIAGLAGHLTRTPGLPPLVPALAIAAGTGGWLGSRLGANRLGSRTIRGLLALVILIAAAKMLLG